MCKIIRVFAYSTVDAESSEASQSTSEDEAYLYENTRNGILRIIHDFVRLVFSRKELSVFAYSARASESSGAPQSPRIHECADSSPTQSVLRVVGAHIPTPAMEAAQTASFGHSLTFSLEPIARNNARLVHEPNFLAEGDLALWLRQTSIITIST